MPNSLALAAALQVVSLLNTSPPAGVPQTELERVTKVEAADMPASVLYIGPETIARRPNVQSPIVQCEVPLILEVSVIGTVTARPSEVADQILNWQRTVLGGRQLAGMEFCEITEIKRVVVEAERPFLRATTTIQLKYGHAVNDRTKAS